MPDPQTIVLGMVFGRWRSQILYRRVKRACSTKSPTVGEYASLLQAGGWRHMESRYPKSRMTGVIGAVIA